MGGERGFDPARKMAGNARKRPIAADTLGLLRTASATGAAVHDADAAQEWASRLDRTNCPRPRKIGADSKYHKYALDAHIKDRVDGSWELEIVRRSVDQEGWGTLPTVGWWSAPLPGWDATASIAKSRSVSRSPANRNCTLVAFN
jgi:putative transposase